VVCQAGAVGCLGCCRLVASSAVRGVCQPCQSGRLERPAGSLFGVGFRGAGVGGYDGGGENHGYESKADKKIMHLSFSSVGFV
jgi:hypothetical protein